MASAAKAKRRIEPILPPVTREEGIGLAGWILIVVIGFSPLALVPDFFLSHDTIPKALAILTAAALLLLVARRWLGGLSDLSSSTRGRCFILLAAAQIVSLIVSTFFSTNPLLSLWGTTWRRFGSIEQIAAMVIVIALAGVVTARPVLVPYLLRAIATGGMAASVYGILQYAGIDPFLDPHLYQIEYFGGVLRPPATMGHALYFSSWLVPVLLLAASAAREEKRVGWRIFHASTAVLAGIAIVLTGTRSALVALSMGGVVLFTSGFQRVGKYGTLKQIAAMAGVLLAVAAFVASPAGTTLRTRMLQWRTETGGPRLQMWREAPSLIRTGIFFGSGPETFAAEFRKIQSPDLSREFPDFYNETPHNALVDAACAQGLPGVLILAGLFALGFSSARRSISSGPLAAGLAAAMSGIFLSSLFASFTLITAMMTWVVAGLAVGLDRADHGRNHGWKLSVPMPVLIVFCAVFLVSAGELAVQDAAWADLGYAVEDHDFGDASQSMAEATSTFLKVPGYELWGSREMATLGRSLGSKPDGPAAWRKAREAAALAEARGEEPFNAAYQSAVLAVAAGDLTAAAEAAQRTIRLAPNWYKGHLLLSQLYEAQGNRNEAGKEAATSASLGWKAR